MRYETVWSVWVPVQLLPLCDFLSNLIESVWIREVTLSYTYSYTLYITLTTCERHISVYHRYGRGLLVDCYSNPGWKIQEAVLHCLLTNWPNGSESILCHIMCFSLFFSPLFKNTNFNFYPAFITSYFFW